MTTIIILFLSAIITMFLGIGQHSKVIRVVAIAGIVLSLLANLFGLNLNILKFSSFFELQQSSILLSNTMLWIVLAIYLYAGYNHKEYHWAEFFTLSLFSLCGAHILLSFTHLLTLFIGVEVLSIPIYVLAASHKNNAFSLEAGLKYFIMGAFSSGIMLFGLGLIYGGIGSLEFVRILELQISHSHQIPAHFQVGVALLSIAMLFKLAVVPFHFWTPDVYSGSPSIVTTFMATIVKLAVGNVLIFLMMGFFGLQSALWIKIFSVAILVSVFIANLVALVQKDTKRMLAYSSISHSAFLLMALIVSFVSKNPFTVHFYLVSYALVSLGIFMISHHLYRKTNVYSLDMFNGLYQSQPLIAVVTTVFILSLVGIPLTAGFMAKFHTIYGIYSHSKLLFVSGILASAISIGYYLKVINRIFLYPAQEHHPTDRSVIFPTIVTIVAVLVLFMAFFPFDSLDIFGYFKSIIKTSNA